MSKAAEKKRETIEKILHAAAKEIQTKGIDGARISVIAEEAGVTKQLVYHYFETKDQITVAILEAAAEGMRLTKNVDIYATLPPTEAITQIIDLVFSGFAKNPSYTVLALDQALHQGDHISASNDFTRSMRHFIETVFPAILERGQAEGLFRQDLDPSLTFWMIFNLVASCFLNNNVMKRVTQTDYQSEANLAQWREGATAFILNALRA